MSKNTYKTHKINSEHHYLNNSINKINKIKFKRNKF